MKKVFLSIMAVVMMLNFACVGVLADNKITVMLDDKIISFEVSPFIKDDRVMVSIEEIAEALGAEVKEVGQNIVDIYSQGVFVCRLTAGAPFIFTKGTVVNLDVSPEIKDGKMFVPIENFADSIGAKTERIGDWLSEETELVYITTSGRPLEEMTGKKGETSRREISLLEGRFTIEMPYAAKKVYSVYANEKYETTIRYSYNQNKIEVEAYDLFVLTCGDLKKDLENLSSGEVNVVGDVVERNGCKYLLFGSEGRDAIVTADDGELIVISVQGDGDKIDEVCSHLFDSLKAADKRFETPKESTVGGKTFNLPENYIAVYDMGPDFDIWHIYELKPSDEEGVSVLIYGGWYPSYSEKTAYENKHGSFLGKNIRWSIYADGIMEAFIDNGQGEYCYHLIVSGATSETKRNEVIRIIGDVK